MQVHPSPRTHHVPPVTPTATKVGPPVLHGSSETLAASQVRQPSRERYYQLQAARQLPQIDCFRTVASVFLCEAWCESYRHALLRRRHLLASGIVLGTACSWAYIFFNLQTSRVCALIGSLLLTPSVLVVLSAMRFDMLKLQARTYEFWHISFSILVGMGIVAISFGDVRAMIVPPTMLGFGNILLIDAHSRAHRSAVMLSALGSLVLTAAALALALEVVPSTRQMRVIEHRGWTLDAVEVSSNALATIAVLMLRNALRIRAAANAAVVTADAYMSSTLSLRGLTRRCYTYRSPVQLVACTPEGAYHHEGELTSSTQGTTPPINLVPTAQAVSSPTTRDGMAQIRYAPLSMLIDAHDVILRVHGWWSPSPREHLRTMLSIAFPLVALASLVLMAFSRVFSTNEWLARLSLVTTIACILPSAALYNRKLLRRLLSSFDFLFLSVQQWAVHITICVLVQRRERYMLPLANALWMQWLLTVDALTPPTRCLLGLSRWQVHRCRSVLMIAVALFHFHDQVMLCVQLVFVRQEWGDVADCVLVTLTLPLPGAHVISIRAIPFILTRMINVFPWTCRLMIRLLSVQHVNELVVLQGVVEYEDQRWKRHLERTRKPRKPTLFNRLLPKRTGLARTASSEPEPPTSRPTGGNSPRTQ